MYYTSVAETEPKRVGVSWQLCSKEDPWRAGRGCEGQDVSGETGIGDRRASEPLVIPSREPFPRWTPSLGVSNAREGRGQSRCRPPRLTRQKSTATHGARAGGSGTPLRRNVDTISNAKKDINRRAGRQASVATGGCHDRRTREAVQLHKMRRHTRKKKRSSAPHSKVDMERVN